MLMTGMHRISLVRRFQAKYSSRDGRGARQTPHELGGNFGVNLQPGLSRR
jgi:hypothetical protein